MARNRNDFLALSIRATRTSQQAKRQLYSLLPASSGWSSVLRVVSVSGCLLAALSLSSCSRSPNSLSGPTASTNPKTNTTSSTTKSVLNRRAEAPITTVTTVSDQIFIELPLGSDDRVNVDDFFRVFDATNQSRLKGMVQIQEVIGPQQSIARLSYQHPDADPITANDIARLVSLVDEMAPGNQLIDALEQERQALDQQARTENDQHQALRQQYQQQLDRLEQRHQDTVRAMEQRFIDRELDIQRQHAQHLERIEANLGAEMAGLRDQLRRDASQRLQQDRETLQGRIQLAQQQRDQALIEREQAIKDHQALQKQFADALHDWTNQEQRFRDEIQAEIETREILQSRVLALEEWPTTGASNPQP